MYTQDTHRGVIDRALAKEVGIAPGLRCVGVMTAGDFFAPDSMVGKRRGRQKSRVIAAGSYRIRYFLGTRISPFLGLSFFTVSSCPSTTLAPPICSICGAGLVSEKASPFCNPTGLVYQHTPATMRGDKHRIQNGCGRLFLSFRPLLRAHSGLSPPRRLTVLRSPCLRAISGVLRTRSPEEPGSVLTMLMAAKAEAAAAAAARYVLFSRARR